MPITPTVLDLDTTMAPAKDTLTPKFFSSKLTGTGKSTGLLNNKLTPTDPWKRPVSNVLRKQTSSNSTTSITAIPFGPLTQAMLEVDHPFCLPVPHAADTFVVETDLVDTHVEFAMFPQAAKLAENDDTKAAGRQLTIQYQMLVFAYEGDERPERMQLNFHMTPAAGQTAARVTQSFDTDPVMNAADLISQSLGSATWKNQDAFEDWLLNYPIAERITRQAEIWSSQIIAEHVADWLRQLPATDERSMLETIAHQMRYLENYPVQLEAYRQIHQALVGSALTDEQVSLQVKQNLNLLMNHTLSHLEQIKDTLIRPVPPAGGVQSADFLSLQQRAAVESLEPLAMTQAGAGAGKSTVILQRVEFLKACGVDPADITVLSFTNAAADNITERNPLIGSMTIARMIMDIYQLSYPSHQLSTIQTIVNSLVIWFPQDETARRLSHWLNEVERNNLGAFTMLNAFVEQNFDRVVEMLDSIGQTSLELQIILCYQKIDQMPEPAHVRSKYLIMDEVQDTSVFEFIFVLKYIAKHAQSLFIVGDASQTLYEFRAANPRALNTLESSGVFTTYTLSTNYRSNQEVLDFANVTLKGLETNQFAQIQLQANSLDMPTAASFKEKVTLDYRRVPKLHTFVTEDLPGIIHHTVCRDYVDERLERGEQVAFLAYSRREVAAIEKQLKLRYPDRSVGSLVSDKSYGTELFSKYIQMYWDTVKIAPVDKAAWVFTQGVQTMLPKLTRNGLDPRVQHIAKSTLDEWWTANARLVNGWVSMVNTGSMTDTAFFDNLRQNLLSFEIEKNQQKLNVVKRRNAERKKEQENSRSDLVVSTIHAAKGLEFDHVVVLYKEDPMMRQENRRMYYVAFTRAMKSEYVLAYGTVPKAPIVAAHDGIVAALTERERVSAALAAGVDPDELIDAEDADGAEQLEQTA